MKKIIAFLLAAALGIGAGLVLSTAYQVTKVTDGTMFPSYSEGEHVFVDRMTFGDKVVERGDVVLFPNAMYNATGEGEVMMKRVIAVAGDEVFITDGMVYVNNKPLTEESYISIAGISGELEPLIVPEDSYFVLGDNRAFSTDSRDKTVGLVKEENLLGKVIFKW